MAIALLLFLGWYFGLNIYKIFTFRGIRPPKAVFWVVLALAVSAVLYTRSVFMATLLYGIMLFVAGDLLRLAVRLLGGQTGARVLNTALQGGLTLLALALIVTTLAWANARGPVLKSYELAVDKDFGTFDRIEIVMLSDLHLGTAVNERSLGALVENVNAQSPDIVCLCGDIFDEGTSPALRAAAIAAFGEINAGYGVYYITGNHDSSISDEDARAWAKVGVTPLMNERVLVAGSFYVAGLSDSGHGGASERSTVQALLQGADSSKPIILLDHRPGGLDAAKDAGVDLQLSGHTHAGQLFPFGWLSARVNKVGYGHVNYGSFNIIVSSGYGVWGMPARLGSRSEYVRITLVPAAAE